MKQESDKKCLNAALRLLTLRDHGCAELAQKLKQRGFGDQEIRLAVNECIRLNYLDDERFSLIFLRQLVRKGYGPKQIQQRMRGKGISDAMIEKALSDHFPESMQVETCRMTANKKLSSATFVAKSGEINVRLYRFLYGRGFNRDMIRQVLDQIC
ncbi:MAG: regulatory protein RecX [Desulfobacteraceae bacterium]|jgi:regulatory protein